jgi:hypothetical protein
MAETAADEDLWKYFVDVRIWPLRAKFDPAGWMSNFTDSELPLARRLLEGFTFYSADLVEQMFRSAFANLSQHAISTRTDFAIAKSQWSGFLAEAIVVRVTGEQPHDADSGFMFSRMTRDVIGLPESQILSAEKAITTLQGRGWGNLIFVDDFVGSGNQFVKTWKREYNISGSRISFESLLKRVPAISTYYVPILCTEYGRTEIRRSCPDVQIVPAHFLPAEYSALSPKSLIWREDMETTGPAFIETASKRAGIPDLNGQVGCWRGFHKLGLAVALSHGYPDATLPIFYWEKNGWKPLIRRATV